MSLKISTLKYMMLTTLFCCLIVCAVVRPVAAQPTVKCIQAGEASDILEVDDGWWEDRRLIYNGIPARILLLLGHKRSGQAGSIAEKVWCEFERLGRIANAFDPSSEISGLNLQSKEGPQLLSSDLTLMLRAAKKIHQLSEGAFDPTLWPLKTLWREAAERGRAPDENELRAALAHSGFEKVQLAGRGRTEAIFSDPLIQLDLGGTAKGYAVERILELIRQLGGKAALVQLGGEVAVFGSRGEEPWKIGVQHPLDAGKVWGVIENPGDLRVSTSGVYRQTFEIAGKRYSHIFDSHTGQPLPEKILSVTLIKIGPGGSSAELDSAATAVMALGVEKGLKLAGQLGVEALIITNEDGRLNEYKTANLDRFFTRTETQP